ncbi:hypothetical protein U1Q18_052358 [Sarracenia purpurea var. burkii]
MRGKLYWYRGIYARDHILILWINTTLYKIGMILLIVNIDFLGRYFNLMLPRFRRYLRSLILLVALVRKLKIIQMLALPFDRSHPPKSLFNESVLSLEKLSRREKELSLPSSFI